MSKTKIYKSILRQVVQQYETTIGNQLWRSTLLQNYKENTKNLDLFDAENILMYLQGAGEYNRLMSLYWPEESMTEQEKIKKTANRVGLSIPDFTVDYSPEVASQLKSEEEKISTSQI